MKLSASLFLACVCVAATPAPVAVPFIHVEVSSAIGPVVVSMPWSTEVDPWVQVLLPGTTDWMGMPLSALSAIPGPINPEDGEPSAFASVTFCVKKTYRGGPFGGVYSSVQKEVTHSATASDVGSAAAKVKAQNDALLADGWKPTSCK